MLINKFFKEKAMTSKAISPPPLYDLSNLTFSPKKDQAKNPHHEKAKVISDSFKKRGLKIDEGTIENTMQLICSEQDALSTTKCKRFAATETLPYDLVVTKNRIHCLVKQIGEGTYSHVYEALVFPTIRHELDGEIHSPSRTPKKRALKVGKYLQVPFSPEKRKLDPVIKSGHDGIDYFIETWRDIDGYSYSLNHLFQTDLMETKFHEMQKPVFGIFEILISASIGLRKVHEENMIHCDIKANNILVSTRNQTKERSDH